MVILIYLQADLLVFRMIYGDFQVYLPLFDVFNIFKSIILTHIQDSLALFTS